MTERRVGWYVHHHGQGHLTRMLAVRPHIDAVVTVFSSLAPPVTLPPRTEWIRLPRDDGSEQRGGAVVDPAESEPTVGGRLHWAPLRHQGHRRRLAAIADAAVGLDAFVVDVSVEVTAVVRLLGLPVVLFTQPGDRSDPAHRLAFDLASSIICPWPRGLHDLDHLRGAADRTHEVGWISRFSGRDPGAPTTRTVLLLGGIGDAAGRRLIWDELHRRLPDIRWTTAGYLDGSAVADPWAMLGEAEVVVSAAGQNSVADVIAAERGLVLVPQSRPFEEQWSTAQALRRLGTAEVVYRWPDLDGLGDAISSSRGRSPWPDPTDVALGARRAARIVEAQLT